MGYSCKVTCHTLQYRVGYHGTHILTYDPLHSLTFRIRTAKTTIITKCGKYMITYKARAPDVGNANLERVIRVPRYVLRERERVEG